MKSTNVTVGRRVPWNMGRLTVQKPPLKLRKIWAIRTRLQMASNVQELAMFNLALDSTPRACDLTRLQKQDMSHGSHVVAEATVKKKQRPVQFEISERARESMDRGAGARSGRFSVSECLHTSPHLLTRQYARIVHRWVASGLDDTAYGTHTMRRTKASLIYRRTKNLRERQLLLGHTQLESTKRHFGIEVDDAL